MSILLEALKKSEAQRQIGRAPGLTTPMEPPGAISDEPRLWLPAGMIVLAALALAWFGWKQFAAPPTGHEVAAVQAGPDTAQETAPDAGRVPARQRVPGTPRTPVARYTKPVAETSAPPDKAASQSVREKQLRAAGVRARASAAGGEPDTEASQPEKAALPNVEPDIPALAPAPEPPRGTESGTRSAQSSFEPETISYWQIPASLRSEMPEMRISVLVYAEQAEDRFLLVNGQRLREGQELDGGIVLEEIHRDRAVFTYRNYRFHLKN